MQLIITEKPSVSKAISAVLGATKREDGFFIGNGYIVSWCFGHLLELSAPVEYGEQYKKWRLADLPIIPQTWKYTPAKGKTAQLKILKSLMNRDDVDCVINACDSGREGELIYRHVYDYAKCTKRSRRLWIASMEDSAIRDGFANLRDGAEYDNLHAAAKCRERADWTVGISATRLFSVLYGGQTLNVGRVQSPTLALLVAREAEIEGFAKEPFYTPMLDCGFTASGEKLADRAAADAIAAACNGQSVTIADIERTIKTIAPPKLFDLTSLQRDANRKLGYTAQQTLDYAQALYEKKLLTYPRTDSKFITADMRDTVQKLITITDFTPDIDRLIGEVSDHHAVLPTVESTRSDISALPSGEADILNLVRRRLAAAVSPKHVYEAVTVTLDCGGAVFTVKGKTVLEPGWKLGEPADDSDESEDDTALPELSKGQLFDSATVIVKESFTKPKPRHTEDTLLSAMENASAEEMPDDAERKGLGTPATRAAVIEKLVKAGFAERKKKALLPTDKAKNLVAILPATLTSAQLTAEWEHRLLNVQRGKLSETEFMDGINAFITDIVRENKAPKPEFTALFPSERSKYEPVGVCPRCGAAIREGSKGFFCDTKTCDFKLFKDNKFWTSKKKPLTASIVTALLDKGHVKLKGLYSAKTGKKYDATVMLSDDGGKYVNYTIAFGRD